MPSDQTPKPAWFHSFEFPSGERADGVKSVSLLRREAEVAFRYPVAGKTVLDIGAWDGFFSFEAERRGASRVLATDHFCWSGAGWGTRQGFDHAHAQFISAVEWADIDVHDLDPEELGKFDVVLFLGVLYHLKDPMRCLELVSRMVSECLVVETESACDNYPLPVARYCPDDELNADRTNFWVPNFLCLKGMLGDCGFNRVECVHTDGPMAGGVGSKSAKRLSSIWPRWGVPAPTKGRMVVHAWR
jgi:tRNA (mo5U34)-methyltransferase